MSDQAILLPWERHNATGMRKSSAMKYDSAERIENIPSKVKIENRLDVKLKILIP
jgi:hypothetical protein